MKGRNLLRALAMGAANAFGTALAPSRIAAAPQVQTATKRGKGGKSSKARAAGNWWLGTSTNSRHWRDPDSPVLAAAIAKRERRAEKLKRSTYASYTHNPVHRLSLALNPFYIAK